jgi:hypothetical protein
VVVGDIGTKFGFNGVDNGFLRLDHVRIREWGRAAARRGPGLRRHAPAKPGARLVALPAVRLESAAAPVRAARHRRPSPMPSPGRPSVAPPSPPPAPRPPALANMMARFSRVTPEGTYVPPPPANSKASYATMLYVRADIVRNSGERPV